LILQTTYKVRMDFENNQSIHFVSSTEDGELIGYIYKGEDKQIIELLLNTLTICTRTLDPKEKEDEYYERKLLLSTVLSYIDDKYFKSPEKEQYWKPEEATIKKFIPDFPFEWTKDKWKGFKCVMHCDYPFCTWKNTRLITYPSFF